ncbi:hypothetical protein [Microbispora triticiradicis]|uniref:hypothetical protein n=1 Tax=Microbispora triticiradicis TaxID=2200763 RepID=UPI001AD634C3|nr:hypothetical protein [Microbispora triticiradicis]MBO4272322.1 hypothetical protein [Microbispora triticiradicis]
MPPATSDDYAWQRHWEEIYTVTFVRGHAERETLRRFGITQADMRPYDWEDVWERVEETDGESDLVVVTPRERVDDRLRGLWLGRQPAGDAAGAVSGR